jgi:hypothetical protein
MEGGRPPEGVPPEDDAAATELAELQEAVLGRWVVVAKQASCREHPDKKSCLIGRYLQDSVVEITEVAPGTPYIRSRTPPQGLAGAAYTHHANGGWVKEVTSKKELLLKKLDPWHATYALEEQVVRAGWDKSGRAHVGMLAKDALVLLDDWRRDEDGVARWRVTLPGGLKGWVRGRDRTGTPLLEVEVPVGDYLPPHEIATMKGFKELMQMHPELSHGQLRYALERSGALRGTGDIYDASLLIEDGMKGPVAPQPTATLEEMPDGEDITEFEKLAWLRHHHLRNYGEAALREEREIRLQIKQAREEEEARLEAEKRAELEQKAALKREAEEQKAQRAEEKQAAKAAKIAQKQAEKEAKRLAAEEAKAEKQQSAAAAERKPGDSTGVAAVAAAAAAASTWVEKHSEEHSRSYWVNPSTGERTWNKPAELDNSSSTGSTGGTPGAAAAAASTWVEKYSEEHSRSYWANPSTGERTWNKP